ncbi:MAG: porin family protein [Chlamydiia bacterium]|nr:porin family protein [Chlamydiia bacterium]
MMKNIFLSTVAVLAMSSVAMADEFMTTGEGFYIGAAYGNMDLDLSGSIDLSGYGDYNTDTEVDLNTFMFQAGYKINQYVAVEARYWNAFGDMDYKVSVTGEGSQSVSIDSNGEDAFGIYVKPMYPVTEELDIYALLGFVSIGEDFLDESGLSWGLGAAYSVTDNVSVFIDYTRLYSGTERDSEYFYEVGDYVDYDLDATLGSLNFGVSYKF